MKLAMELDIISTNTSKNKKLKTKIHEPRQQFGLGTTKLFQNSM